MSIAQASAAALPNPAADKAQIEKARRRVAAAFNSDGVLSGAVSGFVPRDSQRDFALAVFDTIVECGTLIAEAGTGTGKTFAYLVPALTAGGKVLVSTGTKALQDQVFRKDLAVLRAALDPSLEIALLKGRQNYICLHRLERTQQDGQLPARQDVIHLRAVTQFARTSVTGDRAELGAVPENASIWPLVTSTRENCLGQQCPQFEECFVYKARRAAQSADVVVVNHHLFLADLALRDDSISEFLPVVDTVVLDEAHQLPKIAGDFFGTGFSLAQVGDLAVDSRMVGMARAADGAAWPTLSQALEQSMRVVRLALAEAGLSAGARVAVERLARRAHVGKAVDELERALAALAGAIASNAGRDAELDALGPRAAALRAEVASWLIALAPREVVKPEDGEGEDSDQDQPAEWVRWINVSTHGAQFHATPLLPGETFARLREQQTQAWILTSATLTLAGRFDRFVAEIGLPQANTRRWESPFDFARQALLYLPRLMPSPQAEDFAEQVADCAWPVIAACGGRAFVLCTTLRAVDRVAARLRARMLDQSSELPLLIQGTATRRALLDEFRRAGNAVLVGSVSFWEGIDVRGEALSLVVIDKLPFAPPDDPVIEARIRRLRSLGRNAFTEFQLPQAVTLLQQGVGRLIRDERDRGVLMILDDRLLTKSYGRIVLASLPPFARTRDEAEACAFFDAAPDVSRTSASEPTFRA
ncbi:MAG TPA: ATP-dependent DNA helicase [Burkholderiaceae bacterium]|nr:ATP-dependent DNA helicase [Burkholderiaceae bacterium]